jgi:phosphatidylinositol alpha-1,6-mannosyltransferase
MRVLFVSRAFPPTIGGIEKQNAEVAEFLGKKTALTLIANRRGKSFLPLFLPWAMLQILAKASRHDALLLGDGVLAPLGAIAKLFFPRLTVVSIVHGLDLTFGKQSGLFARLYTLINIPSLKQLDGLICVSQNTRAIALTLGIKDNRVFVIPNGVDPAFFDSHSERQDLEKFLGQSLVDKKVVLRIGRFVRHKGVLWFIQNVMPKLPDNIILVAAGGVAKGAHPGDSNIFPLCEAAIKELGLEKRVLLFPNLSWDDVKLLLATADLAVAPNVPVPGSAEGFGISVIEASINQLPIVVSRLEGLQEAVADGENGLFAEPENADDYVAKITWLLADDVRRKAFGEKARAYTIEHYSWDKLSEQYLEVLKEVHAKP